MKIVKAHWEKRNINKNCLEITVEENDTHEHVLKKLKLLKADYKVIKIPTNNVDLLFALQKKGFLFIELDTTCLYSGELPKLNKIKKKLLSNLKYKKMLQPDIKYLEKELDKNLFLTDRVSLDSKFSKTIGNKRYKGWIKDEIKKNSKLYKLIYKKNDCGFFILKRIDKKNFYAPLGGIYQKYQNAGFGFFLNYFEIMEVQKLGGVNTLTAFSSNNSGATSIHYSLGYKIYDQKYVLVKHE
jgi:hypothetical protein